MASKKEKKQRKIAIIGGLIGGGILLLAVFYTTLGPGAKHQVTGSITVTDTSYYVSSSVVSTGIHCYTTSGYDDVNQGTDVTVKDADGKLIALGALSEGMFLGNHSCKFTFEIEVANSDFYSFHIGNRDDVTYTKSELVGKNWRIDLTLGD